MPGGCWPDGTAGAAGDFRGIHGSCRVGLLKLGPPVIGLFPQQFHKRNEGSERDEREVLRRTATPACSYAEGLADEARRRRSSMTARMRVANASAVPLCRARMVSAVGIRSCRMDAVVDLPDSEVEVEVVWTSWSPIRRDNVPAKSGFIDPGPMTLIAEADHMASMPAWPHTFWPRR